MAISRSNSIIERYNKYLSDDQKRKLRALHGQLQNTMADERREAYLSARKQQQRYAESASAYGTGRGYLARKEKGLEAVYDKYNDEVNRSVDSALEKQVALEANKTIKARNAAARAKAKAQGEEISRQQRAYERWQTRLETDRAKAQQHAGFAFDDWAETNQQPESLDTRQSREAALKTAKQQYRNNRREAVVKDTAEINPYTLDLRGDIPTAFWQESLDRMHRLNQLPLFNTKDSASAGIDPNRTVNIDGVNVNASEYVNRRAEAIKKGGAYLSDFKTEYARKVNAYREALEQYQSYLDQYAELYGMQQEYYELARIANDPRYSVADRKRAAEDAKKIADQYNASPIARDFDRYKSAADQFYARLYGIAEEVQLYRAILQLSNIDYDANAILFDAGWLADNGGNSIPIGADEEFWSKAAQTRLSFENGEPSISGSDRAWFNDHGLGDMVDKVLAEVRKEIKTRGFDIREDLPFNTLEDWAKRYGIIDENARIHSAGSYYQEAYKGTHGLDMPEYERQSEKYKKLNAQTGMGGVSSVTVRKATAVTQAAAKKDGILYGLFGEKSLLRFGNNGTVSKILENLVVPLAFLRSRDSAADLKAAYIDAYKLGIEAQRRVGEEGYEPNAEDYYAIDEAKQWDYLAHLVEQGDEYNARILAIQLLDLYYGRLTHAENANTSDFGLWLKNEYAAVQGAITKTEDFASPVATTRGKWTAVNQEYSRRVAEKWAANAKTDKQKKTAEYWAGIWTSTWTSLADNLPARAAGMIPYAGQYISGSIFFMSAGGGAYQEALRNGADPVNAYAYGLAIGASETCLEKLIGGIPLGGKSALGETMEALVDKIPKAWVRVIADMGVDMAGEFTEEYLQEVLEPVFKNWFLGEHNDVKFFTTEALAAGISGALSAALGGSTQRLRAVAKSTVSVGKIMNQYKVSRADAELILKVQQQGLEEVTAKEQERFTDVMAGIEFGEVAPDVGQQEYTPEIKAPETKAEDSTEEYTRLMEEGKSREAEDLLLKKEISYTDGDMNVVTVDGKALDVKNMMPKQRALYALTKQIAKAFPSVQVYMHDTLPASNGVNTDRKSIHIALDAQTKYDGKVASYVLAHEFAHVLKKNNASAWKSMKQSLETFFNSEAQGEAGKNAIARAEQAALNEVMRGRTEANAEAELTAKEADLKDDEYVSGLVEQLFKSPEDMKAFLDGIVNDREMAKPHKRTILDTLKMIIDKIKAIFSKSGRRLPSEMKKCIDEVRVAFESLETAKGEETGTQAEAEQTASDGETHEITNDSGEVVGVQDGNGHAVYSRRTYEEGGREKLEAYLKVRQDSGDITKQEAQQILESVDEMYRATLAAEADSESLKEWSEADVQRDIFGKSIFSWLKSNAEYGISMDASLICIKRRTLDAVLDYMVRNNLLKDFDMAQQSVAAINDIIRAFGFETACGLCYIDAKRYRAAQIAAGFAKMYNDALDTIIPKGKDYKVGYFNYGQNESINNLNAALESEGTLDTIPDSELDFSALREVLKQNSSATVAAKIAKAIIENPAMRRKVLVGDFMSSTGFTEMGRVNPTLRSLYNSKKGTGGPKATEADTQYLHELLDAKADPEKYFNVGGLRVQSFSDYIPRLVFDYVEMIGDMAAKKLPSHAYTKELMFALQFGLTNMKINMSLIPALVKNGVAPGLDENGNYAWRDGQSFGSTVYGLNESQAKFLAKILGEKVGDRLTAEQGFRLAKKIQESNGYSKNCGTFAIGVSNEHILKMLGDPDIRMVIPYHKSGLNHLLASLMNVEGFTDYTDFQNTKKWNGKSWTNLAKNDADFNINEYMHKNNADAKTAADAYLKWCEEKGYQPKFSEFSKGESSEFYYKLLIDFNTYDATTGEAAAQEAVRTAFPKEGDAFGSMESLMKMALNGEDVLQGRQDEAVPKIVAAIQRSLPSLEAATRLTTDKSGIQLTKSQRAAQEAGETVKLTKTQEGKMKRAYDEWWSETEKELPANRYSSRADSYLASAPKVDTKAVAEAVKNGSGEVEGRFTVDVERAEDGRYSVSVEDAETGQTYTRKGRKSVNATEADIERTASALIFDIKATEAEDNVRLAERMHEGAKRAQERRRADERETELKEHYQERIKKMHTEQLRREVKNTAMNWNKKLVKMLANPTENRHVPLQLAREVAEFTGMLTDYIDGNTKRGQATLDKIMRAYEKAFTDEAVVEKARSEDPDYAPRGDILNRASYDEQLVEMMKVLNELMTEKSFAELTRSEMELLLNTVRGVVHTVTEANKLIGETEKRTVWEVGDKVIRQFESSPKIPKGIRGYLLASLDLRRIARIFSGSREDAEFVKLVDQLNEGAIEKERVAQELQAMFKAVTDKYGDEIKKWYGKKAEWIDTGVKKDGLPVKITKGMRVSLALHVLNEGNMRHIERGGLKIPNAQLYAKGDLAAAYANGRLVRLTAEQINEIISHMTEAEKAYVEAAKEFFHDRTGYYVNKTSLELSGYTKANVENYFPIHTDRNFTKTDFDALKVDGSIEGQGFLKERVTATNPVYLEDITSVVNRQIRGVALYAGLAIPMRNFNAVMNVREYEDEDGVWSPRTTVRETLASDRGVGTYGAKVVEGFLKDLSEMSHVDVTPSERLVGKLGTNYVKAVLLGNAKVAMKQTASYPTAAAVIPWKYLGKALVAGGKNKRIISRADVELINKYTPLYEMRREGNANEIASIMNKPGLEQKLPGLLGWTTKMDVMTVGRLWSAAEYMVADQQKDLEVGSDEYYREVAKVFNRTIQQTQPNFTPLQRSAALRSKNPLVRSLTLFGTQRMQNGGIMIEAAMELLQSKGKSREEIAQAREKLGRAVASQIVQNVLLLGMAMLVDVLRGRMKAYQDDDDKELTLESISKYLGDQFLANFMGSFLGGSEVYEVISNIFKKAQGKSTYDTEFSVPAIDAIESLIKFVEGDIPTVIKYLFSGDHTDTEKKNKAISVSIQLAKVFGYATGIPLENVVKDVFKGIYPAILDHIDRFKTGEMIPWLHQSGRLDNEKTKARYQEWIDSGRKGSVFLAWDKKLKALDSATDKKAAILFSDELTDEEKEMLLRMYDINAFTFAEDVSMEDYDAAKAEYDRHKAERDEMKASLTEAEFAEWSKEHSADFLRYLNSTELSGAQKLALLETINPSSEWQEKLDALSGTGIPSDAIWDALYSYNCVFQTTDARKRSEQLYTWLEERDELSAEQKFALLEAVNSSNSWDEKLDAIKDADISADVAWNALYNFNCVFESSDENKKTQQFVEWIEKQSGLSGEQKFALLSTVNSSNKWKEKVEGISSAKISADTAWKALYQYNNAIKATDDSSKAAQFAAWLDKQSGLSGAQKWALWSITSSKTAYEKAQSYVTAGLTLEQSWKAMSASKSGLSGAEYHSYLNGLSGVTGKQRFLMVEFSASSSNWLEHAEEAHKSGVSYDVAWKCAVEYERVKKDEYKGKYKSKKAYIKAFAMRLGLTEAQADALLVAWKWA